MDHSTEGDSLRFLPRPQLESTGAFEGIRSIVFVVLSRSHGWIRRGRKVRTRAGNWLLSMSARLSPEINLLIGISHRRRVPFWWRPHHGRVCQR